MSTQKPDLTRIWAETAPTANVVDPDTTTPGKVTAGWQAEVPPFEHFNFLQKWFSQALAHFNEEGIAIWDNKTLYPISGLAKGSDGKIYNSKLEQFGNDPVSDSGTNWEEAFVTTVEDASQIVKGIARLATQSEVNQGVGANTIVTPQTLANYPFPSTIVEANNQLEEDAAFAAGALAVIRLDLLGTRDSLFMDFENPPTFEDLSEFAHVISVNGTPSITDSVPAPVGNYVADLTGNGNFLSTPDDPTLRLTSGSDGWGIELYYRLQVNNISNFLVSKGAQGVLNDAWYLALLWDGSDLYLSFVGSNNSPAVYFIYPHQTDVTNFHHISVNSDNSNIKVYIDGVLANTVAEPTIFEGAGPMYIGAWNFGTANTIGGYIDQLVISNEGPLRTGDFTPPSGV